MLKCFTKCPLKLVTNPVVYFFSFTAHEYQFEEWVLVGKRSGILFGKDKVMQSF